MPALREQPDPLLRRGHAAGRGRAAHALSRTCGSPRLDSDALAARRGFEAIYDDFRDGRVDVLVGTQLAAKGLDLPTVTLAAVIAADVTLNLPDYLRAGADVPAAGPGRRARGKGTDAGARHHPDLRRRPLCRPGRGRAWMLTASPTRSCCAASCSGYPPFGVLARLLVADPDRERAEARGREAAAGGARARGRGPRPARRRTSLAAPGAGASRSSCGRTDVAARAAALEARAGRRGDRRGSRVPPLAIGTMRRPWSSAAS